MNRPLFADVDWTPVIEAIENAGNILLTTHCNPDGDGIGSQIALYDVLLGRGRPVRMHNRDGVPRIYRFLPHAGEVGRGEWKGAPPDVVISLDAGERARLGFDDALFAGGCLVNIDHHASNRRFGDVNLVDPRYCATGAMVHDLLLAMGAELSETVATALYTAILTDTASFRLDSASAEVYRLAARLIDAGADPWTISQAVYESRSKASLRLLTLCLNTLELRDGGRSAWVHVTRDMYRESGADVEDTEGLIDYARSIDGVEVAVFLRNDDRDNVWKVSFRGKNDADVGALATRLGGGGHRHAAGCQLEGTLDEVRAILRPLVSELVGA